MRVTVLGCSPSWPSPGEALSGYHLALPDTSVLLDIGNGVVARLRAEPLAPPAAIILSHLHADHISDLFPLCYGLLDGELGMPAPVVYAPPGGRVVLDEIARGFGFQLSTLELAYAVREYRTTRPLEIGGATIRFVRTPHSAHSYMMRIDTPDSSISYTGDTPYGPHIAETANGCDLLVCEATELEPVEHGGRRVHCTPQEAAHAAAHAACRRLVLTHCPASRRTAAVNAAAVIFPTVEAAVPGAVYDTP